MLFRRTIIGQKRITKIRDNYYLQQSNSVEFFAAPNIIGSDDTTFYKTIAIRRLV